MLTHLLLPQLVAGAKDNDGNNARIVNVSSSALECNTINYEDFRENVLAQLLAAKHLNKICMDKGLKVQAHAAYSLDIDKEVASMPICASLDSIPDLFFMVCLIEIRFAKLF